MARRHPDTGWNVTHRCGLLARGLRLPLGSHAALLGRRARERRTKAEDLSSLCGTAAAAVHSCAARAWAAAVGSF